MRICLFTKLTSVILLFVLAFGLLLPGAALAVGAGAVPGQELGVEEPEPGAGGADLEPGPEAGPEPGLGSEPETEPESGSEPEPHYFDETKFPEVHINIKMEDIHKTEWQDVSVSLGNAPEEFEFEEVGAEIRGRGNTTWMLDKKPFRVRFFDARPMLDSGHSSRTWTFIANHSDKSLLRNYSAYYLASMLDGMYAAPFARFVNLYLGGVYQGVYMLSIQVSEIAEGRVELTYDDDPALCEYLIEMDDRAQYEGVIDEDYVVVGGIPYAISFPSGSKLTPAHAAYVKEYLTRVDNAIGEGDPALFPLIDLPSFVDFYIVQELYKNVDVGFSSVFMQIRGQGKARRLEMGPVWDFDIAAGNANYVDYKPKGLWAAEQNRWYKGLFDMPEFAGAVAGRWNEVKDVQIADTVNHINYMAETYQKEFERNFSGRWQIMKKAIWPNPREVRERRKYMEQVKYLTGYLGTRKAWLDEYFNTQINEE